MACLLVGLPLSVSAQSPPFTPAATPTGTVQEDAALEGDLTQLAKVLGRAHALRVSCNGQADQVWRMYMREFLDVEAPDTGERRSRLIEAFNTAFRQEQSRSIGCRQEAQQTEADLAVEGRQLADRLAQRYIY